jgi:predicted RNA binding protein with dsRBD fold (UPF0201 family)
MTTITVEALVRPSEDESKVRTAILNLFPDIELRREGGKLVGSGSSLQKFGQLLKRYRIRDAARGVMMRGLRNDNLTVFRLSKQAAFMEKVGFADRESPLGEITLRIESSDLLGLLDTLAPDTRPLSVRLAAEAKREGRKPPKVLAGSERPEFKSKQDLLKLVEEVKEEE